MTSLSAAVVGSGPAALSAAVALACRGVETVLIAPSVESPWSQTFSMWTDQWSNDVVDLTGVAQPWLHRWDRVLAFGEQRHEVGRSYGTIDNEKVKAALLEKGLASGLLSIVHDQVVSIEHDDRNSWLSLTSGSSIETQLVFDGTGANSTFVQRETPDNSRQPVMQTATGRIVTASCVPFGEDAAVFMDWRGPQRRDASFLYALPFGNRRWLFEETSLGRRGGLSQAELSSRLDKRLNELGIKIEATHDTEVVSFRMDVGLPLRSQKVIGIGASGALVHPATGYSVASSFRMAPRIASVVAEAKQHTEPDRSAAIAACALVLWSEDRRRARGLETYGLERLLTMNQSDTRSFFDVFFSLSEADKATYLGGEAGTKDLTTVMWKVFRKAPRRLRQRLATGNPVTLARTLLN